MSGNRQRELTKNLMGYIYFKELELAVWNVAFRWRDHFSRRTTSRRQMTVYQPANGTMLDGGAIPRSAGVFHKILPAGSGFCATTTARRNQTTDVRGGGKAGLSPWSEQTSGSGRYPSVRKSTARGAAVSEFPGRTNSFKTNLMDIAPGGSSFLSCRCLRDSAIDLHMEHGWLPSKVIVTPSARPVCAV